MKQHTRRPGRPAGTDYTEDLTALAMVADKLLASPGMKPMTAMKAVFDSKRWRGRGGTQRDTTVARWLRKWPDHALAMLSAARDRAQMAKMPARGITPSTPMPASMTWANSVTNNWFSKETTQALAAAAAFRPSPDLLRAVKIATSSLRDFEKNHRPIVEAMARLAENGKTIREAYPLIPPYSPALAASLAVIKVPQIPDSVIEQFRQISNSPTIIAMRELMKKRS